MSPPNFGRRLEAFAATEKFGGKGPLCVALVITSIARDGGLPIDPESLLTNQGGQVKGLGKSGVQNILADHNISRVLAHEGARTSRGSIGKMRVYVKWLNELAREGPVDFVALEAFWIGAVKGFFAGKPLKLRFDSAKNTREIVRDLFE
jgi:hypothetical protein